MVSNFSEFQFITVLRFVPGKGHDNCSDCSAFAGSGGKFFLGVACGWSLDATRARQLVSHRSDEWEHWPPRPIYFDDLLNMWTSVLLSSQRAHVLATGRAYNLPLTFWFWGVLVFFDTILNQFLIRSNIIDTSSSSQTLNSLESIYAP